MAERNLIHGDLQITDTLTYIKKDASNNMTFTDTVLGTKTLSELFTGTALWTVNGSDIYRATGNVGIGTGGTIDTKLHVRGNIKSDNGTYSATLGAETLTLGRDSVSYMHCNTAGGYIAFLVNGASKAIANSSLLITTGGNIGIDTATPSKRLVVNTPNSDDDEIVAKFIHRASVPEVGAGIFLGGTDANDSMGVKIFGYSDPSSNHNGRMSIYTPSGLGVWNLGLTQDRNGNVGINDTTPSYKLDVHGSIRAVGAIIAQPSINEYALRAQMYTGAVTVDQTEYRIAGNFSANSGYNIASGITESGYRMGANIAAYDTQGNLDGTLTSSIGLRIQYGIHASGSSGTITTVKGLDFHHLSTGGTQTTVYSIYSPASTPKFYHEGNVGFGAVPGTDKLQVEGNIRGNIHKVYVGTNYVGWMYGSYTSASDNYVSLENNSADGGLRIFDTDGHAVFVDEVTADDFLLSSDRRLKTEIEYDLSNISIDGLKPTSFYLNGKFKYGFIAQDMLITHPELVNGTGKEKENGEIDYYSIKENSILSIVVKELQELKAEVYKLKKVKKI